MTWKYMTRGELRTCIVCKKDFVRNTKPTKGRKRPRRRPMRSVACSKECSSKIPPNGYKKT